MRKNNKTITAIGMAALMTAAGVLTAMAAQSPTIVAGSGMSQSEAAGPGMQSPETQEQAPIWGTIISADNESIDMDCPSGNVFEGEVIVNISGDTLILDGENGYPIEAKDLQAGETVYAYIGPAMTMSLPPMTNATMIFANVPADFKVPDYVTVKSVVTDAASSQSVLTAMDGTEYTLADDCGIVPYLTRNIVTLDDLTQGRKAVVWSDGENTATRIMVFAE